MEENQYLMWMKRKQVLKSHIQAPFLDCYNNSSNKSNSNSNSNSSSWEERAFAEDAARILGGCIWPPRSYSCNFCKREFRSAQALGGHMNVHRRDRARLKQTLITPHHHLHNHNHDNDLDVDESSSLNHHHHQKNDCKSLGTQHQQFSAAAAENNNCDCLNNPNHSSNSKISSSEIPSTTNISNQEDLSHIWGQKRMVVSPHHHDSEQKGQVNDCVVETSLSVGLNSSVFGQKLLPNDYSCCVVEEDTSYNKRPKVSSTMSSLPVFLKPCYSNDRCFSTFHHQSVEFVLGMEDLDLELRLGKPQKA